MAKEALKVVTDSGVIYIDSSTGESISDPTGYQIVDNPSKEQVQSATENLIRNKRGDRPTGFLDSGKGKPRSASDDFGYIDKPALAKVAGFIPGPIGMAAKVGNVMVDANNTSAINEARKYVGLEPLSNMEAVKGALVGQDKKVTNKKEKITINDKKYDIDLGGVREKGGFVGNLFGKDKSTTSLTPQEARKRQDLAAVQKGQVIPPEVNELDDDISAITGVPVEQIQETRVSLPSPAQIVSPEETERALSTAEPATVAPLDLTEKALQEGSAETVSPLSGSETLQPGGASSSLTPSAASAISPEQSETVSPVGGETNPLGVGKKGGLAAQFNKSGWVDPSGLNRVRLADMDFTKVPGIEPNWAAVMNNYRDEAIAKNLDLAVDVNSMVRSQEQQNAIKAAGNSKTKTSFHMSGTGTDISPVDVNDQKGWAAKRQLGEELGLGQLDPSWDPAHLQPDIGVSAGTFMSYPRNELGVAQVPPDVAAETPISALVS